jgi:hypothetical protein
VGPLVEPGDDAAWTMGQIVFGNDATPSGDLLAHEYVYVLEYQGLGLVEFTRLYNDEVNRLGGLNASSSTGPRNRVEAIGYLWAAWIRNYGTHGEPYPWVEFR